VNRRLHAVIGALGFGAAVGLPLSATATSAPSNDHTTPIAYAVTLEQHGLNLPYPWALSAGGVPP